MLQYYAQFYPEDCGGYSVYFPDLPGCGTCGDDLDEALAMAEEALTGYLATSLEDGEALPIPSDYETAKEKALRDYRKMEIPPRAGTLLRAVNADVLNPQYDFSCTCGPGM